MMESTQLLGQTSLISADDTWALWAVIAAGVAASIYLEQAYAWAARLSGPVVALLLAMLLSNVGIMPQESPVYDAISGYLVPVAVALLLFRANVVDIVRTSRAAFVAMQIATVGTIVGAFVAYAVMAAFQSDGTSLLAQITGMMSASYIGGGVNFFAMKEIYNVDDGVTSSLLVADNFVMAAAFVAMFWMAANAWMKRKFGTISTDVEMTADAEETVQPHRPLQPVSLLSLAGALAVAILLAWLASGTSQWLQGQFTADSATENSILMQIFASLVSSKFIWLTLFTITAATLFQRQLGRIQATEELGGYLLYLFLFTIGLPSEFLSVVRNVPSMFVLCTVMAVINLAITLLVGRLFKLKLEVLLLASNASLGGPPTAAAMAASLGWKKLVTPGLLIGLWGYIVGTAIGVCITQILASLAG